MITAIFLFSLPAYASASYKNFGINLDMQLEKYIASRNVKYERFQSNWISQIEFSSSFRLQFLIFGKTSLNLSELIFSAEVFLEEIGKFETKKRVSRNSKSFVRTMVK